MRIRPIARIPHVHVLAHDKIVPSRSATTERRSLRRSATVWPASIRIWVVTSNSHFKHLSHLFLAIQSLLGPKSASGRRGR
jgi:hypothetical protein